MLDFITATGFLTHETIRIRPDAIIRYNRSLDGQPYTIIVMSMGGNLHVDETPEEIEAKINQIAIKVNEELADKIRAWKRANMSISED